VSVQNNKSSSSDALTAKETDLTDIWMAIRLHKKVFMAVIGVIVICGWSVSYFVVKDKYKIESSFSLGNYEVSEAYSSYTQLKLKQSILPSLVNSADNKTKGLFKKINVSLKKGTNLIRLRSLSLKKDIDQHKFAHNLVVKKLLEQVNSEPTRSKLSLSRSIDSIRYRLKELNLPTYLLKMTFEFEKELSTERYLLDQNLEEKTPGRLKRIEHLNQIIKFEKDRIAYEIETLESRLVQLEDENNLLSPQPVILARLAPGTTGLSKSMAIFLTVPFAIFIAFIVALLLNFTSLVQHRSKASD
jgi:hypothetical protein